MMSRKQKERERKLTALILTGLMLGNGMLFATVAEAGTITLDGTETSLSAAGLEQASGILRPKSDNNSEIIINGVASDWINYSFATRYKTGNRYQLGEYSITMNDGELNSLYGGFIVGTQKIYSSNVTITAGTVKGDVYGGCLDGSGSATENTVTINGGVVGSNSASVATASQIYGGYLKNGTGSATYNTVIISGGTIRSEIRGGRTDGASGNANYNNVAISGGTIKYRVWGGYSAASNAQVNSNTITITGGTFAKDAVTERDITAGSSENGTAKYNTLTIETNGTVGDVAIDNLRGGYAKNDVTSNNVNIKKGTINANNIIGGESASGTASSNKVTIDSGTINASNVIGGESASGAASSNTVTINAGTINASNVIGGESASGAASSNTVTINAGTINANNVIGGQSTSAAASSNKVIIYGGSFSADNTVITGGKGATAAYNTIEVRKAIAVKGIKGGDADGTNSSGNTLDLYTKGITVGSAGVSKAQTIALKSGVTFEDNTTVLSANSITDMGTLDISSSNFTGSGTMTLLASSTANDLDSFTLKYSGGTAAMSSSHTSQKVNAGTETTVGTGVQLTYDAGTHYVKLDPDNSYKNVLYTITDDPVKTVTLGEVAWAKNSTVMDGTDYTYNGDTVINGAGLTFTGTATDNPLGQSMILLANAPGITDGHLTQPDNAKVAVSHSLANGVKLGADAAGAVSVADNSVKYTINNVTLNSVDIGDWTGTAGAVPDNWNGKAGGISVTGTGFTAPTLAADTKQTILTSNTDGYFANAAIATDIAYKSGNFSETAGSTTLSGKQSKGVKADGKNLVYSSGKMEVDAIVLGETSYEKDAVLQDKSAAVYDYSGVTALNAANFKLNMTEAQATTVQSGDSMTLLKANNTLNNIAGQTSGVEAGYTAANGTKMEAEVNGTVSAADGSVKYAINNITLNSVDIGGWTGTVSAVPEHWNSKAGGISVTGTGFTTPTLAADSMQTILTSNTDGYFADASIDTDIAYKADNFSETAGSTTLSGKQFKGVKADGKNLVYSSGKMEVDAIALGENSYEKGAVLQDRSGAAYDYSGVKTLETSNFKMNMTEAQAGAAQSGDSMTLLKANNTLANIAGQSVDSATSYTTSPAAGVTETFSLTSSVGASGGNVVYTVTGKQTSALTFGTVNWLSNGVLFTRPEESVYTMALVDTTNISFTGVENLTTGDSMILIGDFGDSVRKIRGESFALGSLTGQGHAYWQDNNIYYIVDAGTNDSPTSDDAIEESGDVNGGTKEGDVIGGEAKGKGIARDNKAEVKNAEIKVSQDGTGGDVTGAKAVSGTASQNEVNVTGSTVEGYVTGAVTTSGTVTSNVAHVSSSKVGTREGGVTGAYTSSGLATGNTAKVENGSIVQGNVNGAASANGTVSGNMATVADSTVKINETYGGTANVIGGDATSGEVNTNEAVVSGSTIAGNVLGASSGTGAATANKASVTNSQVAGNVAGAQSANGAVSQNTATVASGSVDGNVYGGKSDTGAVTENTADVAQGKVDGSVYGGKTDGAEPADTNTVNLTEGTQVKGGVYGGYSENGTASDNMVKVKKATIEDYLYGGKSKSQSSNDKVYFDDGTVLGIIGGGCETATNNLVSQTEGIVSEHVIGGFADKTAIGNMVTITGGTVTGSVIGGYGAETADSNTIYLSGGKILGNTITSTALGDVTLAGGIYGGYSSGTGTTKNNSVYLYSTADIASTNLYGGNNEAIGNNLYVGMLLAGATEVPWTGGSQSVGNISNFETINFTVVPWSKTQAAITITDGTASDLSKTTVAAKQVAFTGVKSLNTDDTMTLLDQSKAAQKATNVMEDSNFTVGKSVTGTGKLSLDDNGNVIYKVSSVSGTEQTHNTLMGAEASLAALSVGNEFIGAATEGLILPDNIGADGIACYAKIGGGKMRQETGSHINVNTWNSILALGHQNEKKLGKTEYGAFVEYGRGNYTTDNHGLRGDGKAHYTGGGMLGKWTANDGLYVEGSFRVGSIHEDAQNLLRDDTMFYSYNTRAPYKGFHLGVGKKLTMTNGNEVDVYGKYFYNRKNGVSFTANGDDYQLDDVTSQVVRLGARYILKREQWNFYGDLSYEHELDGKAEGRVNGATIRSADTSGGTARLELGATLLPTEKSPWSLDLNVTGFAGKKRGVNGGVTMKYLF